MTLRMERDELIRKYRIALADAIRRPMGVVPASAEGLVSVQEMDAAEVRRTGLAQPYSGAETHLRGARAW